ncbi:Cyanidin 3-O-glucoside 7-O-glucosyltransferase (acyl-glucose) [Frankliniella fusca]|uniref:Cyanidin 3-O-glucoside 7-O-glucosyltransferase (Acyl-glucose) n=1 Tax=Frankliniella fusca TaxID=407009 RepID=A0AAE1GSD2_9NEOP|nr:Cyanidin 3-O-glucoside 7-O-glucosyltransferase (acyl-glucose) [Frankliniella fusca]
MAAGGSLLRAAAAVLAVALVVAGEGAADTRDPHGSAATGGAVYTRDNLAAYASVWGHDETAKGVELVTEAVLERVDLLQSFHNLTGSARCRRALDAVLEARAHLKMWALKMDYSSVALPAAVLSATMSNLGDFDGCTALADATYCLADVEIRPLSAVGAAPHTLDERSPFDFPNGRNASLWDVLRTSGNRRRYRRDSQQWAVCLPTDCTAKGRAARRGQDSGQEQDEDEDLGELLAAAVSPMARALGVHLRVALDPIDCYPDPDPAADGGPAPSSLRAALSSPLFVTVSLCLLLFPTLVVVSFVRESVWGNEQDDLKGEGAVQTFLSCFSIRRNSRALTHTRGTLISAIQGLRVLGMVGVIVGHRAFFPNMGPILNPDLFENEFNTPIMMNIINGTVIVTIFFVITAFLEARGWLMTYDKRRFSLRYALKACFGRWLRLVPALAVMVAFDALWLEHLGSGPIWNQLVVRGAAGSCKVAWWTNLLFINNYYRPGGAECLLQTWFVAAVLQLSCCAPFVMWAVHRCSRRSPWRGLSLLLALLAAFCVVLYVTTAYMRLLPATTIFPMNLRRANIIFDPTFSEQYLPAHTNAISYIVGLIAGAVVYFARASGWLPSQAARRVLGLGIPLGYVVAQLTVVLGVVYLLYTGERPWLESLWAPARTLAFSAPVAWFIVACALGCGGAVGWLLSRGPLVVLGRLTYCVYLSHASMIFATAGSIRQPHFVSRFSFLHTVAGDFVFSFFIGYLLHICVEAPVLNIMMIVMPDSTKHGVRTRGELARGSVAGQGQGDSSVLDPSAVESQGKCPARHRARCAPCPTDRPATMRTATLLLVAVLAAACCASAEAAAVVGSGPGGPGVAAAGDEDRYKLPEGFLFGAGISAIQTEGAWDEDGKAESAGDRMLHTPLFSQLLGSHDVAADSYHRYAEDVAMAKQLKLKVFRFSMSWARLLPTADATKPNEKGVKYYHALLDKILEAGLIPMVTLYHFDHPQLLQDEFLGWESDKMVEKFAEYADFVFKEFGSKVTYWTTLNEPNQYCMYFNMLFVLAGVVKQEQVNIHRCMHNAILAHMKAYNLYKTNHFSTQKGQVGFTTLLVHAKPNTTSVEDVYAAEIFNQIHAGKILHPVVFGDYPDSVKKVVPNHPSFTDEEKKALKGSTDFIGLNIYNGITASYNVTAGATRPVVPVYSQLLESLPFVDVGKPSDLMAFDRITPEVMGRSVEWTWQQYGEGGGPIMIMENGYSGSNDKERAVYLSSYMRSLVGAHHDFGVKLMGYCAWSLIDAFEWSAGYSRPFGLVHVDYEKGTLARSLKPYSSKFFNELADTNVVPYVEPDAGSTTPAVPDNPTDTTPTSSAASALNRNRGASLTLALAVGLLTSSMLFA